MVKELRLFRFHIRPYQIVLRCLHVHARATLTKCVLFSCLPRFYLHFFAAALGWIGYDRYVMLGVR